jgi:hypothetical protein
MTIGKCAHCEKEIDLDKDAQTCCPLCEKDFCFAMSSSCFTEYHRKNELYQGHMSLSFTNPSWKINLVSNKD